jgi:hypothetical protein
VSLNLDLHCIPYFWSKSENTMVRDLIRSPSNAGGRSVRFPPYVTLGDKWHRLKEIPV